MTLTIGGNKHKIVKGEKVLDTLLKYGYDVNYNCRTGNCDTCRIEIVKGCLAYGKTTPMLKQPKGTALCCIAKFVKSVELKLI